MSKYERSTKSFCQRHHAPSQAQLARLHKAHKKSTISGNKPIQELEQLHANTATSSVSIEGEQLCLGMCLGVFVCLGIFYNNMIPIGRVLISSCQVISILDEKRRYEMQH